MFGWIKRGVVREEVIFSEPARAGFIAFVRQLFSYFIVGGVAALVEWSSFYFLNFIASLNYLLSVALAFLLATGVNYLLCIFFVFDRGRHPLHLESFLIYFVSGIGLLLNVLLMFGMHGMLHIPAMQAKIISTGLVFIWNFMSRKVFIFG